MSQPATRNLTILLTDIEDFTPKTSRKTRADILRMLEEHKRLVLPLLEGRGGQLIKTIGDAFLMVFESPTDAVLAGVEVQRVLRGHNADKQGDDRLDLRIAINAGEVTLADNDVFGEPVNITSRINGIAEAGEVFFTEAVYLAMNKREVPSSEVGLLQLKGIAEKIRVYKVVREKSIGDALGHAAARAAPDATGSSGAAEADAAGVAAKITAPAAMPPAGRQRRAAALLLDAAFCSFFLSSLFTLAPLPVDLGLQFEPDPELGPVDGQVLWDADGLQVGNDVRFAGADIRIGEAFRLGEDGIAIDLSKWDDKTAQQLGLAIEAFIEREEREANLQAPGAVSFCLFWFVYSTFFLSVWGATPGKRLFGVRIVRSDRQPLDWKTALIRSLFSLVSGNLGLLGYLWGLFGSRRTWHDRIAGTEAVAARQ